MKKLSILGILMLTIMMSCIETVTKKTGENPFLTEYDTPYQVPPFDIIDTSHYIPAFKAGIEQGKKEIQAIIENEATPTFENTILPYDNSGEILRKVSAVFYRINSAETSPTMQKIAREVTPMLTRYRNEIALNEDLFKRIKYVYDHRNEAGLDPDQIWVVEKIYEDFERNGANLSGDDKEKMKHLNEQLAMLSLKFGENLLAETNAFKLVIDSKEDLAGLPEPVISAAAETAAANDMEGKWVFTLQKPSMIPFLQYADNRDLREKIYKAYYSRGDNDNENDNKAIACDIIRLRDERVELLGYNNYANYRIAINMAKTPENVYDFLYKVWEPALGVAKQEVKEMQKIIDKEGGDFKLQSWDWWYYAEKVRKEKFNLDENQLKPYFSLQNVKEGMFMVANKLYGIEFEKLNDLPVYHEEVETYKVTEADGSHVGILYLDYHPRPGKRVGAWCGTFREQVYEDGKRIAPVVTIVTNFTRPTGDLPSLLTWNETNTLFHEFGHALHNLFQDGRYRRTSGRVPRDFVELPSQIMENWASDPEVLKMYAKHYKTGEGIPDELIEKLEASGNFNQGFVTVEYVAASLLDLDWHTLDNFENLDADKFEKKAMDEIGLIDEIIPRYRTTYFNHIFNSGYAAGYYVYLWAEVLDSDAFNAFKESGDLFNQELAAKFRKHVLAESGDNDGMVQYKKFRGEEPSIDALLEKRGLK